MSAEVTLLSELRVLWAIAWLVVGVGVAWSLARGPLSLPWALLALLGWPAMLPLLRFSAPAGSATGPLCDVIGETFDQLGEVMSLPGAASLECRGELAELRAALLRVDGRLAVADRILVDGGEGLDTLQEARERSVAEIEEVLHGVRQFRVQVGLLTLAGDATPVRSRLVELQARVAALEEVASSERVPATG